MRRPPSRADRAAGLARRRGDQARAGAQSSTRPSTSRTVFVICGASLFKSLSLRAGGAVVARSLGGTRVERGSRDPGLRRLHNVVEEMAIASGVTMPEVYVLEHEDGINAFAAGNTPADAAVAVTRVSGPAFFCSCASATLRANSAFSRAWAWRWVLPAIEVSTRV